MRLQPAELPVIDSETFEQLLELDEDDEHEFSKQMAWEYFGQMEVTLTKLDKALCVPDPFLHLLGQLTPTLSDKKDLLTLSSLGHFLKGSSAALGAARVQQLCENIQYYGELKDHRAGKTLEEAQALELIETALANVKEEYAAAEEWLKTWYKRHLVQVA